MSLNSQLSLILLNLGNFLVLFNETLFLKTESYAILINNTEVYQYIYNVLFAQFPPMITSCKTINCHNQYNHRYSGETQYFHHQKDLHVAILLSYMSPPSSSPKERSSLSLNPAPSLTPGKHQSILHFYNFIISRMLCKWSHEVCNLGFGFFRLA